MFVAPTAVEYVPAEQFVQMLLVWLENVPALQLEQVLKADPLE